MPHASATETQLPQLHVFDGPLDPAEVGLLRPSYPSEPTSVLRQRYETDGYVFIKGCMPRDVVLSCREKYMRMVSPSGVLKPGTEAVDGVFDGAKSNVAFPGIGSGTAGANGELGEAMSFVDLALAAHKEEWYYEGLCKHPSLRGFVARLTGWGEDTLGFKRTLLRNNVPGTQPVGVHYDQLFLRHGPPTSVTAWVPIGDVSVQGGGLIYLENGENLGEEIEDDFFKKAKETGLSEEETLSAFNQNMMTGAFIDHNPGSFARRHHRRWLVTNYEAGDVVFHKPYTIHASTINHDPNDVIRLGTDIRFVDSSKPWDTRWSKNFFELNDGV